MYDEIKQQFEELQKQLMNPELAKDPEKLKLVSKMHSDMKRLYSMIIELEDLCGQIEQNNNILQSAAEEEEYKQLAQSELPALLSRKEKIMAEIDAELNPSDPYDKKNIIMEIRAGTGGDESALFAADLFRMYSRFVERKNWKLEILDSNRIGIGGFKEIIFSIEGNNVYGTLKYEAGTHRVQRVPDTEKQGRIHTSAATVAVLPEADEVDLEVKNEDLRIDTYAASGPGGQKVNTTNSAVRITHLPTGVTVQCQDQKSQHQNKEKALQILRSRLLAKLQEEKNAKEAADRKLQIGSGDRSEKIRTYNFPQDRVTDHRVKMNWHSLDKIMDGGLDEIIETLQKSQLQ